MIEERRSPRCSNRRGVGLLLETRMQRVLFVLWLIGAIVYATDGASAQPVETASIQSEQVELHSVVVDTPQVISLSHASPDTWDTLPSSVQLNEQRPATGQECKLVLSLTRLSF